MAIMGLIPSASRTTARRCSCPSPIWSMKGPADTDKLAAIEAATAAARDHGNRRVEIGSLAGRIAGIAVDWTAEFVIDPTLAGHAAVPSGCGCSSRNPSGMGRRCLMMARCRVGFSTPR